MKNLLKKGEKQKKSQPGKTSRESSSSKQSTDTGLQEMGTISSAAAPSSSVYRSCNELPLDKFMAMVVENKTELLIREGVPPLDVILLAWADIYLEYSELVDERFIFSLGEQMSVEQMKLKIMVVGMAIESLSKEFDQDLIELLKSYGFDFPYDPDNILPYLQRVITMSKSWLAELQLKENDLVREGKSGKPSYDQFYEVLEILSKDAGYHVRAYDLTVYEYATRVKRLIKRTTKQKTNERPGT